MTVEYAYATYSGTVQVQADDNEEAIAKARKRLRPYMTLPMAYERFAVVATQEEHE